MTIPLSSENAPGSLSQSAQIGFMDWFVETVVAPLERADPNTFDLVMRAVA